MPVAFAAALGTVLAAPLPPAGPHPGAVRSVAERPADVPRSAARAAFLRRGYLVADPAGLAAAKAEAGPAAPTGPGSPGAAAGASASTIRSWDGIRDATVAPGDTTGAIGPSRYVELVNVRYAIYDRTSNTPLSTGTLGQLTGDPGFLSDPQVLWDAATGRFYYVAVDIDDDTLAFGFSRTATPSTSADFCRYILDFGYGTSLPDYPKLGDTADFLLIGVNVFASTGSYIRSDVDWVAKPPAGTSCPAAGTLTGGVQANVRTASGLAAETPVPAIQADPSSSGWIVSASSDGATLTVIPVGRGASGAPVFGAARSIAVASFAPPPNAPQSGTSFRLDTLDGRLTQAISAFDPTWGVTAVWTQHTVAGGAGSHVRWYELDPARASLRQSGAVSDSGLYVFNGAVSPDRAVTATGTAFGGGMVLGFNTSSALATPAVQMVTRPAGGTTSAFSLLKQSPTSNRDGTCGSSPCRWGDYAAATPDPGADPNGAAGRVWLTNAWTDGGSSTSAGWRSWNWAVALAAAAPDTSISSGPAAYGNQTGASFAFSSSSAGAGFECSLDGAAFVGCVSPKSYSGLADGKHSFLVRAVVAGVADPSPASWAWTVDTSGGLLVNGSFEGSLTGWQSAGGVLSLVSPGKLGSAAARVKWLSGSSFNAYPWPRPVGSTAAGAVYSAGAWVRSDTPGRQLCLLIREFAPAGGALGDASSCLTSATGWQQLTVSRTATSSGGSLTVNVVETNALAGDSYDLDGIRLDKSP